MPQILVPSPFNVEIDVDLLQPFRKHVSAADAISTPTITARMMDKTARTVSNPNSLVVNALISTLSTSGIEVATTIFLGTSPDHGDFPVGVRLRRAESERLLIDNVHSTSIENQCGPG